MKNLGLLLLLLLKIGVVNAQSKQDQHAIISAMDQQAKDWNNGDLNAFMQSYWQSDSLQFVGKSGVTYGYQNTLNNYVKRYPDREAMGTLDFNYISLSFPAKGIAFMVGKFHLTRPTLGDLEGHYTLVWKKIKGKWLILSDHSS
jgi:ketosteroid isomerase-like protein